MKAVFDLVTLMSSLVFDKIVCLLLTLVSYFLFSPWQGKSLTLCLLSFLTLLCRHFCRQYFPIFPSVACLFLYVALTKMSFVQRVISFSTPSLVSEADPVDSICMFWILTKILYAVDTLLEC